MAGAASASQRLAIVGPDPDSQPHHAPASSAAASAAREAGAASKRTSWCSRSSRRDSQRADVAGSQRGHEQRGAGDVEDGVVERHRRGELRARLRSRSDDGGTHTTTAGSTAERDPHRPPAGGGHDAAEQRGGDVVGVALQLGAPGQHVGGDLRPVEATGRRRPPPRRGRAGGRPRAPRPRSPGPGPSGWTSGPRRRPRPPAARNARTAGMLVVRGVTRLVDWSATSPASRCRVRAMPRASKPGPRLADDAGTRTITAGLRGPPPPPARRATRRSTTAAARPSSSTPPARATPAVEVGGRAADHQARRRR